VNAMARKRKFPISRDPPEGGTGCLNLTLKDDYTFPISRDPPEGGTRLKGARREETGCSFQFLGIPPKGEHS